MLQLLWRESRRKLRASARRPSSRDNAVVTAQATSFLARHRCCDLCGSQLLSKGPGRTRFRTAFGTIQIPDLPLLNNDQCRNCRRSLHSRRSGLTWFQFPLPTPQQRFINVKISGYLAHRVILDRQRPHRLGLELIRKCPSNTRHPSPPLGSY
jgi:hypothetical protein